MKILIAALLAVFSTSVMAEWTWVGGNERSSAYADFSTIRKSGDRVKMWNLYDLKVAGRGDDDRRFLSTSAQFEYDCKEETSNLLAFIEYSKNMGDGEVIYTAGNSHTGPRPVAPGSLMATLFKTACGK